MWSTTRFVELDARAAFDLAIMIEEDAQLRYEELGRLLGDDPGGAGDVFRSMAVNERKHATDLGARRDTLFQADPRIEISVLDMGADAECPAVDDDALPRTAREALEVALAAEKRAGAFYADALPHLTDGGVRSLFEDLAHDEAEHAGLLERKIAQLGSAAVALPRASPLGAPRAAPAQGYRDRAALECAIPLFDMATQAVAVGVIVEGLEPGEVAAVLGVSRRTVAWKLKRFLDLARRHVAVALAAAALTGCAGGVVLPDEVEGPAPSWAHSASSAVVEHAPLGPAEEEPAAEPGPGTEAVAAPASDLEFSEGLAQPPQGTVAAAPRAWAPPADVAERPTPVIEDVWPHKVPSSGGEKVVIRGKNLEAAQVLFGLEPARILEATADQLTVAAPAASAGLVAIVVTNRDGEYAVADGTFQFYL